MFNLSTMSRADRKLAKKRGRQERKNQRLLEKMGINPKQGCCSYKPSWMLPHAYPGGVNAMGFPMPNRQIDTRRVPESFPRGYKISLVEVLDQYGDLLNNRTEFLPRLVRKIRIRKMLGNRNGSEKEWAWRTREEKPIPRSAVRLEIQQELAGIAEQERADLAELAKLDEEMQREIQEWLNQENQRQEKVRRGIEAEELDRERELCWDY